MRFIVKRNGRTVLVTYNRKNAEQRAREDGCKLIVVPVSR